MTQKPIDFIYATFLSKDEVTRRDNLIIDEISKRKESSNYIRVLLLKKPYKMLVSLSHLMASHRSITDRELIKFIEGIFLLPIYYNNKDEKLAVMIDELIDPAVIKYSKTMASQIYQSILIDKEVSGDEVLKVGGVEIKLSKKELLLHLNRVKFVPLSTSDIGKLQKDLVDYKRKQYFDKSTMSLNKLEQLTDKIGLFKKNVIGYGFLKLSKVAALSPEGIDKLIDLIVSNKTPYCIAMLDYIGFLTYLMTDYFKVLNERDRNISNWFNVGDRAIRGNINALNKSSEEDRKRYPSYSYKEKVEKDYEIIKEAYALKMP